MTNIYFFKSKLYLILLILRVTSYLEQFVKVKFFYYLSKERSLCNKLGFLIPTSLQPGVIRPLIMQTMHSVEKLVKV